MPRLLAVPVLTAILLQGWGAALLHWVASHGIRAAFPVVALEEAGLPLPIPGDLWLVWVGYQIGKGRITWLEADLLGTLAVASGSTLLYAITRGVGPRILSWLEERPRFRRLTRITPANVARAEDWFQRYGFVAICFGRLIPGLRVAMTVVSGTLRVPYPVFILGTTLSAFIWVNAFFLTGRLAGRITPGTFHVLALGSTTARVLIFLAVVAAILGVFLRWRSLNSDEPRAERDHG